MRFALNSVSSSSSATVQDNCIQVHTTTTVIVDQQPNLIWLTFSPFRLLRNRFEFVFFTLFCRIHLLVVYEARQVFFSHVKFLFAQSENKPRRNYDSPLERIRLLYVFFSSLSEERIFFNIRLLNSIIVFAS